MRNLTRLRERMRVLMGRVFMRSTFYAMLLLVGFAVLVTGLNYYNHVGQIEKRLAKDARDYALLVSRIAAREIKDQNHISVEKILDALTAKELVVSTKAYTRFGRVFTSDIVHRLQKTESRADREVLTSIQTGAPLIRESDGFHEYIRPVYLGAQAVGAVGITMSKEEIRDLKSHVTWQTLLLVGLLFLVFVPVTAFLMYRSTHGISRLTDAAHEATQGFLDTDMEVDTVGEVGELQGAFLQMIISLRNNIQKVEYLAHVDRVTELPNKLMFSKVATQLIDLSPEAEGGLLFIDLDRFKAVNDMHGHAVGDRLLQAVGDRLAKVVEPFAKANMTGEHFLGRFANDEFIVILPGTTDPDALKILSDRLVERISAPFQIDNLQIVIRTSIGVALYPQDGATADKVLRCADMAMFAAKQAGRDQTILFNTAIRDKALERETVERCLRTALQNNELRVFYQPKMDIMADKVMGCEALLRWNHPELGNIPPDKFIPIAEECGLITSIGEFVLQQSLSDMNKLRSDGYDLSVAVNVSPTQFLLDSFTDRTLGILAESSFPANKLELEITESSVMDDPDRVFQQIMPIRDKGVLFAIDDFGTGHSSLHTLANMPFDTLKIDRSFVMNMAGCEDRRAIVQLILMMAQQLRINTVAEGVEDNSQYDHLKAWGATYGQGYLWSPPVEINMFRQFLDLDKARRGLSADFMRNLRA